MQKTKFFMTLLCLLIVSCGVLAQATAMDGASDQKAGSLLVFPLVTSNSIASNQRDTIITISNFGVGATGAVKVHYLLIDNADCSQSDQSFVLTASGSWSIKASEFFPDSTGYLIAYVVDAQGCPIAKNVLVGNAFVHTEAGYFGAGSGAVADGYNAQSFWSYSNSGCDLVNGTADLKFDGSNYDLMPNKFALEFQPTTIAPGQSILLASMNGDVNSSNITSISQSNPLLVSGCDLDGDILGPASRTGFFVGKCQLVKTITSSLPVVGVNNYAITGSALMTFGLTEGALGLMITPKNLSGWSGIRQLHYTGYKTAILKVPLGF